MVGNNFLIKGYKSLSHRIVKRNLHNLITV